MLLQGIGLFFGVALLVLPIPFLPSLEWKEQSWILAGPIWFAISLASVWAYCEFHNEIFAEKVRAAILKNKPPPRNRMTPFRTFGLVAVGPFIYWWVSSTLVTFGIPMMSTLISSDQVSLEFTVEGKGPSRLGRRIGLEGHYFFWGAVRFPSEEVYARSAKGTKITAKGVGNRYGVWYSELVPSWN